MKKKIGFIGTGTMAKAIIAGLISSKFEANLLGYDLNKNNYDFLIKNDVKCCSNINEIVESCDYIILCVKPQNMEDVLNNIKKNYNKKTVLVSIAAGINENFVAKILGEEIQFIQVMPNTPLIVKKGAVAICKGKNVNLESFDFIKQMFETCATVCEIEPNQMNNIVAINGSAPAYIYIFTKGFLTFANKCKINEQTALKLFCATLKGSAKMMETSGKTVDDLIKDVSSPGGTTLAGLEILKKNNIIKTIEQTCIQTAKRAVELSR